MKEKSNKNKKWLRFRHKIVRNLLFLILYPYSRLKYGLRVEKFKEKNKRQYLILFNHQTAFDQFFVGMTVPNTVYYVASEDIFSNGWTSALIKYLAAPIPIKKQSTDVRAVINCIKVAKEGGTIALAPEGNRTFSGRTVYINPAIAPLAKKIGLPILFCKIEGGYGVHPRWSDKTRRGKMSVRISRVLEPEEYVSLSDCELMDLIKTELYVDEANSRESFFSKRSAEYIERAMYVCPECGLSRFESDKDRIKCLNCSLEMKYTPEKTLVGINREVPFKYIADWYDYQCDFVNSLNLTPYYESAMYEEMANVYSVELYKKKELLCEGARVLLFGNRITLAGSNFELNMPFEEISSISVLGKNKLNLYFGKELYQIKGDKRFCALKFVNIFYHWKSLNKGDKNGKFLGL